MKSKDLTGIALDYAVAKASGDVLLMGRAMTRRFRPSTSWNDGGPLITLERIDTWFEGFDAEDGAIMIWAAQKYGKPQGPMGHTPLEAAMRSYVKAYLGDEVEVPEVIYELDQQALQLATRKPGQGSALEKQCAKIFPTSFD